VKVVAPSALALVLAIGLAGCTLVAATRGPTTEQGEEACTNFLDDDLDGALDCDDVECDGLCAEETLERCIDGRDNDGDGVTDAIDARCWHVVAPTVKRCATVRGSSLAPPIGDGSLLWRGVGATIADPRDPTHAVFAPRDGGFRVAPVASTTGALDGLHLHATLRVSTAVETSIALVPAGELGDATSVAVFTRFVRFALGSTIYLATDAGEGEALEAPAILSTPTWAEVDLDIVGRTVTASLALDGHTSSAVATIQLSAALVDPISLDVVVLVGTAPPADVPLLAELSVDRRALPACGRDELVPEMHAPGFDLLLDAARGGADGSLRCAISTDNGAGTVYRAEGDEDWAAQPDALGTGDVAGAAIDWDPARNAFVGMLAHGPDIRSGAGPTSFERVESTDCRSFRIAPWSLPGLDPSVQLSAHGASYVIDENGAHTLRFLAARGRSVGILSFTSADGELGSFVQATAFREVGPEVEALVAERAQLGIDAVGRDDLVILAAGDRGLVALTPRGTSGRFSEIAEPLLLPSDVAGTFDRGSIFGPPQLLPSTDPHVSRLFYAGTTHENCFACLTSGSALFSTAGTP
jgi:hypothetical protein